LTEDRITVGKDNTTLVLEDSEAVNQSRLVSASEKVSFEKVNKNEWNVRLSNQFKQNIQENRSYSISMPYYLNYSMKPSFTYVAEKDVSSDGLKLVNTIEEGYEPSLVEIDSDKEDLTMLEWFLRKIGIKDKPQNVNITVRWGKPQTERLHSHLAISTT
jgi:hypothetical protein